MMAHFKSKNNVSVYTAENCPIVTEEGTFHRKVASSATICVTTSTQYNTINTTPTSTINTTHTSTINTTPYNTDNVELIDDINSLNINPKLEYSLPTGSVPKTNTHHYDKQLLDNEVIHRVMKEISIVTGDDKKERVKEFVFNLTNTVVTDVPEKNEISIRYLTSIVNDWGNSNNYDNTNNLSADDIMYVLSIEWYNLQLSNSELIQDFSKNFFIQCMDMQTGPCPQGRVIRLWQLASIFLEWFPLTSDDIII